MHPDRGQSFCSYVAFSRDESGAAPGAAAHLPHRSATGRRVVLGAANLHFFPANGHVLHRSEALRRGPYLVFLQGEFYEPTDAAALLDAAGSDGVDADLLAARVLALNGVFSGLVFDTERRVSYLFTDRFGFAYLYYRAEGDAVVAASHLWPFLGTPGLSGGIDREAAADILMCGFPLGEDTPAAGVSLVLPGTIVRIDAKGRTTRSYFGFTRRPARGEDFVGSYLEAARGHFGWAAQQAGEAGLSMTLSGGHDSRVLLNSMLRSGIRPACFTGYHYHEDSDSRRARKVAAIANVPATIFNYSDLEEQDLVDANVLLDGAGTGGWGMNLGKRARDAGALLYFGTTGDTLSGAMRINPDGYESTAALVEDIVDSYHYDYSVPLEDFLRIVPGRGRSELLARVAATFPEHPGSLYDRFMEYRLQARNFRRVRMFVQGAYLYNSPAFFFHDNRISDLYWRTPLRLQRWQKLQVRLCSTAVPRLGWVPATKYPIPVLAEPLLLPLAKKLTTRRAKKMMAAARDRGNDVPPEAISKALDALDRHGAELRMDLDALRSFLEVDPGARRALMRIEYLIDMLRPAVATERSSLFGEAGFRDPD